MGERNSLRISGMVMVDLGHLAMCLEINFERVCDHKIDIHLSLTNNHSQYTISINRAKHIQRIQPLIYLSLSLSLSLCVCLSLSIFQSIHVRDVGNPIDQNRQIQVGTLERKYCEITSSRLSVWTVRLSSLFTFELKSVCFSSLFTFDCLFFIGRGKAITSFSKRRTIFCGERDGLRLVE